MDIHNQIHKVGGTHLTTLAAFDKVKNLFDAARPNLIIISALGRTTANLQKLLDLAKAGHNYEPLLLIMLEFHQALSIDLFGTSEVFNHYAKKDISFLTKTLVNIKAKSAYTTQLQEEVLSIGEYWSSFIFGKYWTKAFVILDAAKILVVEKKNGYCAVDWQLSQRRFNDFILAYNEQNIIITGYIASDKNGNRLTLGFEGSDFSASIFGKLFNVGSINIWTNVNGLYTADPLLVKEAKIISELSYNEAFELSYLGNSIFHQQTIEPAKSLNIPIFIRNAYTHSKQHTKISSNIKNNCHVVCGISLFEDIILINIEGSFSSNATVLLTKVFSILSSEKIRVYLTTQANSSNSICFAIKSSDEQNAFIHLNSKLKKERSLKIISGISIKNNCSMLAIVGDGMIGKVGASAKLLRCLAKSNINILALSQGSSERNISIIIEKCVAVKALNVIHSDFYLSKRQLQIALIGPGNVGAVLLKQLLENKLRLEKELNIELNITCIVSSNKMLIGAQKGNVDNILNQLKTSKQTLCLDKVISYLKDNDPSHTVVIDCTASETISEYYEEFIKSGFHLITPNKKVTSGEFSRFKNIQNLCKKFNRYFLYETNVCAGLPIIKTLQDLVATGDEIIAIKGVFSGTLSYLFNEVNRGIPFSKALFNACKSGLTEPDPREDLNGFDVARKCICLAREIGIEIELSDVNITPILPNDLMLGSVDDFLSKTVLMDEVFNDYIKALDNKTNKLVYSGSITKNKKIALCVEEVDNTSPFYNLKGTDNMVIFLTKRYQSNPLIVQGPGAGADVTAAGVFADLLRLVSLTSGQ